MSAIIIPFPGPSLGPSRKRKRTSGESPRQDRLREALDDLRAAHAELRNSNDEMRRELENLDKTIRSIEHSLTILSLRLGNLERGVRVIRRNSMNLMRWCDAIRAGNVADAILALRG